MSFVYQNYFYIVVAAIIIYCFIVNREENKFFSFVERFWFKKRSFVSHISKICFLVGFSLLALSLLDLRGPEERIKAQVPSKRTIVLMDTSASMLAEDVRPSRLEKAVLLAKHFARKAVGHQISVIVFSETQMKIVPFTSDLDLIDSRLESIRGLKNHYASSALSLALQEAIQSLKDSGEDPRGNIVVLTDGEETSAGVDLKIPEGVYVAFVGIGTQNGGRIPLDDKRGMRYGHKKYQGKDVITKLNLDFFKEITSKNPQTKFWQADTYALPSEEIVAFFEAEFVKGVENQDMVIRPVFMQWLVIPGILLLVTSYLLKMVKVFALVTLILVSPTWANEDKEQKSVPEHIVRGLEELRKGHLSKSEKIGLAYELQKNEFHKEALKLYQEELDHLSPEQRFNYGTSLFSNKKLSEGFSEYKRLLEDENVSKELKEKIAQNALLFLRQSEQDKEDQKKKEQDKKESNDQGDQGQGGQSDQQSSNNQNSQNNQEGQQDPNKDQDGDENKDNKQDNKEEDQKDGDEKDKEKDAERSNEDRPNLPPKKLPAKLKQLMSDDRKLQMEMIERGTKDMNKRKSNSSKDW